VETPALLFEAAQLLLAIVVEGGIAAGLAPVAVTALGTRAALLRPVPALVDESLGLFGGTAEHLAPKDVGEHGEAERPPYDKAQNHQSDGQRAPLRFDDRGAHR